MAKQLLSDAQMNQLRQVAILGMITPVLIERRSESTPPAGGDYGDDFVDYTQTSETRRTEVKGWFYSTPTPVQTIDEGSIVTVNTYRLFAARSGPTSCPVTGSTSGTSRPTTTRCRTPPRPAPGCPC